MQFVSLGRFGFGEKVKFLVGNEYSQTTEIIESSAYLRGIKVQQAKKSIISGFPGSALELVGENVDENIRKKLHAQVDEFNIKAKVTEGDEFQPENAIKRVRKALDLIEIFGITLLAAVTIPTLLAHNVFKGCKPLQYRFWRSRARVLDIVL